MSVYISHDSALEFWRANGSLLPNNVLERTRIPVPGPTRSGPKPGEKPDLAAIRDLGWPEGIVTEPFHVVIADPRGRTRAPGIQSHIWHGCTHGTFVRIDKTFLVCSPNACFVQMAESLDLVSLIRLGCEMCGTYRLDPLQEIAVFNQTPLTNSKSLCSYIKHCAHARGRKLALRASRYIVDNSASPAETNLALMLSLPVLLGGYGLPKPEMNRETVIERSELSSQGHAYRCDLAWPKESGTLAVEYDSNAYHTDPTEIVRNAERRNILQAHGVRVIVVTAAQASKTQELDTIAASIARGIRFRRQPYNAEWIGRNELLHRSLYGA